MTNIIIAQGDITQAEVDAIVNAANPFMLGGGGVDGAIHKAAGPQLLEECKKVEKINGMRCPTGEARITSAGQLLCRYVIHTVGPIYTEVNNPAGLLASAYRNSLNLALENQCESIAFPAISCGVYGYPAEEAAEISIDVCSEPDFKCLTIYFYLFSEARYNLWCNQLSS